MLVWYEPHSSLRVEAVMPRFFSHCLRIELGDRLVGLLRVVEDFELGEAAAVGEARLGEQPLGFFHVLLAELLGRVAGDAERHEAVGGHLAGAGRGAGDFLAIERQRQRPADAHVVERLALRVEQEVVRAEVRLRVELVAWPRRS